MPVDLSITTASVDGAGRGATAPVVVWGTYDLSKPRTRILLDGLRGNGVSVHEIHGNVWPEHADKSQLRVPALALALVRALLWYPVLIVRFLFSPRDAVVIVPYLGALDVLVLWPFARLRGQRVVWDMFLSLYDTVVNDRRMVSAHGPASYLLWSTEWLAARAADLVLLDTQAHARHIARLFHLPADRTDAVPVGAETDRFPRLPRRPVTNGPPRVLFYGQLIPLHGIETILRAALSERGRGMEWRIIGTGQDRHKVESALADAAADHVTWETWVPYETLVDAIGAADVCLGIFGASDKAASVVPNKVYQALVAGRAVITRDSPAMRETFADDEGLKLVPHSDADAILDAIDALAAEGFAPMPIERLAVARPETIATRLERVLARTRPACG